MYSFQLNEWKKPPNLGIFFEMCYSILSGGILSPEEPRPVKQEEMDEVWHCDTLKLMPYDLDGPTKILTVKRDSVDFKVLPEEDYSQTYHLMWGMSKLAFLIYWQMTTIAIAIFVSDIQTSSAT